MTTRSTSGISVSVCQTVTGALPEIFVSAAIHGYRIVLDHRVRQQSVAHCLQVGFGPGAVCAVDLDVEHLALAHRSDAGEAKAVERMLDRLPLRVENAVLEGYGY